VAENPVPIQSQPGIQRDGTLFGNTAYSDGLWVRFANSEPRKMGGYRAVNKYLSGAVRTLHGYTRDLTQFLHSGSANLVERLTIDSALNSSVITDRTPASLVHDPRNLWQFDVSMMAGTGLQIMAQVAPNLDCICNSLGGQLFYGDAFGTAPLTPVSPPPGPGVGGSISGGIVALGPYLVAFGNNGFVAWSTPGDPTDYAGTGAGNAFVTGQKIIRGLPLRGGPGASPSGLLWSADSLIRMIFNGDTTSIFSFDTISAQISLLSAQAVVEYDGIYYWAATDRFLMFNGVVREIPNAFNRDLFFDNVNHSYREKVFSFVVPRFGEVWWCFPFGDATEPNHAVIYNVRENVWYDTPLPNGGRGAATSPAVFRSPILTGVDPGPTSTPAYRMWVHERGYDEVDGLSVRPIPSFFETAPMTLALSQQQPSNKSTQVVMIEPDFIQQGPMTVQLFGKANARANDVGGPIMEFPDEPTTPEEAVVFFKEQRRQLRFRFGSDVVGGYYQMGRVLAQVQPGDGTML
jgi:hypothetical protein